MDYKPTLPKHNDNVSHEHPLKEFFILLLGVSLLASLVYWVLGLGVDLAVDQLSYEDEAILFKNINFTGAQKSSENKKQQKLKELVADLRTCIDIPYEVTVDLVEADELNALAFPGGKIIVFKPLIEEIHSENGLAFVLAHELAHFKNRDHLRGMGRGLVLAVLSTLVTGAGSDISQILVPSNAIGQAQYSQEREAQADIAAIHALHCNYGHVGGAEEFFQILLAKHGLSSKFSSFLESHPQLEQRIDALHRTADQYGYTKDDVLQLAF